MRKIATITFGLAFGLTVITEYAAGQCKVPGSNTKRPFFDVELDCAKTNSESSYLTDGKDYRALLSGGERVEFVSVFFGGNTYRIAACTDVGGPLSFTIQDYKGNTLFTNKDYENAPYWDVEFPTTIECSIFIQLPPETIKLAGGNPEKSETASESDSATTDARGNDEAVAEVCAVVVIGYKQ